MKTILIADDDPVMVKLLEFNMVKEGYRVSICREGLSVAQRAREIKPDLAIFDLMLPGRSGLSLIEDFKKEPDLGGIPLVVVTGQGKGSIKDELIAAGADCVFTKPFSPNLLVASINELVGK